MQTKRHNRSRRIALLGLLTAVLLLGQLPALGQAPQEGDQAAAVDAVTVESATEAPSEEPEPLVTQPQAGPPSEAPVAVEVVQPSGDGGGGTRSLKKQSDTTTDGPEQQQVAPAVMLAAAPVAASTPVSHNYEQHGNLLAAPGWHGGANNSGKTTLAENDSVPYRLQLNDLGGTPDAPVYVEVGIEWDSRIKSQGTWVRTYDFITSYDKSHNPDPCAGTALDCTVAPSTGAIPDDPAISSDDGENGAFKAWGGTVDTVGPFLKTTSANSETTRVVVKVVSTGSDMILTWGGHIAYRFDWPGEDTAADASGASYHMYLAGLNGRGGKEDLQLMASAILIPGISLTKTADILESATLDGQVGDTVRYTYVINNGGETGLHAVTLTDDKISGVSLPLAGQTIAAGGSYTYVYDYVLQPGDVGTLTNNARVDALADATDEAIFATDSATVNVSALPVPDLQIGKSASDGSVVPGDSFSYTITAANGAAATASAIAVSITDTVPAGLTITAAEFTAPGGDDDCGVAGQAVTCAVGDLAAGESAVVTITVTATAAACGTTTNDATADGSNTTPVSASDPAMDGQTTDVDVVCAPDVSLTKSASAGTVDIDDDFSYTITADNSGTATATALTISDDLDDDLTLVAASYSVDGATAVDCTTGAGNTVDCGPLDLPVNGTAVVTINVTATQEACGSVRNQATSNDGATSDEVFVLIPCPAPQPGMTLTKTPSQSTADLGDTVTYTYRITNTGAVTLSSLTLDDDKLGGIALTDTLLLPGEFTEVAVAHVITASEMDDGSLVNVATATGLTPSQTPVTTTATATVDLPHTPDIEIVKTADVTEAEPGDAVTYTYVVTNTGNVTLTDVFIDDDIIGTVLAGSLGRSLAAGESATLTAVYTVTEDDLDNGGVTNVATAGGMPPVGPAVTGQDTVTVAVAQTVVMDTGFLVLSKTVRGTHEGQRYAFSVDCEGVSLGRDAAFTIPAGGGRHEIATAVPVGTTCRFVETDAGGAARTSAGSGGDLVQARSTIVTVSQLETTVSFVNSFADAADAPADGPADAEDQPDLAATGSRALAMLIAALAALGLGGTLLRRGRRLGGDLPG